MLPKKELDEKRGMSANHKHKKHHMRNNKSNERIRKTIDAMATGQSFFLPFSSGKGSSDVAAIATGLGAEIVTRKEGSGIRVWVTAPAVQGERVVSYAITNEHPMPTAGRGRPKKETKENKNNIIDIGSFSEVA